MRLERREFNTN